VELITNIGYYFGVIDEEEYEHILIELHRIRNLAVDLLGILSDTEKGLGIACVEIDLLGLLDEMKYGPESLSDCLISDLIIVKNSLELSILCLIFGRNPDACLIRAIEYLTYAVVEVDRLVQTGTIPLDYGIVLMNLLAEYIDGINGVLYET
jgi:predicted CopG family antitoxin